MATKKERGPVRTVIIDLPEWADSAVDWHKRWEYDDEKMNLAVRLALHNVRLRTGGPFGAAIFDCDSGKLLSVGVNMVVPHNNPLLHAEIVAIMMAGQRDRAFSLAASGRRELFTSCEPCAMCMGAVLWSGVKRLVCAATGGDARAIGFDEGPVFPESYEYIQQAGIEVVRGVRREDARNVFKEYVKSGGAIYNGLS